MEKSYNQIVNVLEDMGYLIFEKDEDDFVISDYVVDSLQFIDFIVRTEEKLGIELSDDFLEYDLLLSAKGFSNKIGSFISETQNDSEESQINPQNKLVYH